MISGRRALQLVRPIQRSLAVRSFSSSVQQDEAARWVQNQTQGALDTFNANCAFVHELRSAFAGEIITNATGNHAGIVLKLTSEHAVLAMLNNKGKDLFKIQETGAASEQAADEGSKAGKNVTDGLNFTRTHSELAIDFREGDNEEEAGVGRRPGQYMGVINTMLHFSNHTVKLAA